MGAICNARAVICLAEGDPAGALDALRDVLDVTPPTGPAFTLVETHLLAGIAHLHLGDRNAAAAAAEAALAAAEPDRLIFPFAMTGAAELLDALPRHETAHGALLADIVDLLRGEPAPSLDRERSSQPEELSPSELARAAVSADEPDAAGDRERALRLDQHRQHAHPQHLLQARARDRSSAPSGAHGSCASSQAGAPEHRRSSERPVARTITRFRRSPAH